MIEKGNLEEIRYGVYLCRSQAGFRKLLKKTFVDPYHTWEEIKSGLRNYPSKYPAIVIPDRTLFFECGSPLVYIVYPNDFNDEKI